MSRVQGAQLTGTGVGTATGPNAAPVPGLFTNVRWSETAAGSHWFTPPQAGVQQ